MSLALDLLTKRQYQRGAPWVRVVIVSSLNFEVFSAAIPLSSPEIKNVRGMNSMLAVSIYR